jgi:signal transduction histidine kinase
LVHLWTSPCDFWCDDGVKTGYEAVAETLRDQWRFSQIMHHSAHEAAGVAGFSPRLAHRRKNLPALTLQIAGCALIITLLGLDGYVGFHGAVAVRADVAEVEADQSEYGTRIGQTLQALTAIGTMQRRLSERPDDSGNAQLRSELAGISRSLAQVFTHVAPDDPNLPAWRDTERTATDLLQELQRTLTLAPGGAPELTTVPTKYADFATSTARLIQSSRVMSESLRQQVEQTIRRQSIEDRLLLSGCLIVACLFLWTAARTHRLLKEQSEELNVVSLQLLEKQESLARRLSRDLHDELGQSLTALKTNFSRHAASPCVDGLWMADCSELLRDSIRNAHEISQLLHPTVLEDFGLHSALAWLCERFEGRNGMAVKYTADFRDRLRPQAETHVFRIAQEALTNVARHAQATAVRVTLRREANLLALEISDNGVGLPGADTIPKSSFGLTGMKARTRSLRGQIKINSTPGHGTTVRVDFPFVGEPDEEDSGPVS